MRLRTEFPMKSRNGGCVIATLMCLSLAMPADAQTERRWSVAWTLGASGPGPAADLEAAMRASGFDEQGGGCVFGICFPPTENPFSNTGFGSIGFPFALQIDHRLPNRRWGLSVLAGRTPMGVTMGLHAPYTDLHIDYAVDSLGFMPTLEWKGLAVGVGPALHIARTRDANPQVLHGWEHDARLGALVQGRMMHPARSRLFFDLNGQYRYVGSVDVGPITPEALLEPGATFPASKASFDHWHVAFGAGVRF
jgi:hypothetical protein